jgi:serine/threonine protein kinase
MNKPTDKTPGEAETDATEGDGDETVVSGAFPSGEDRGNGDAGGDASAETPTILSGMIAADEPLEDDDRTQFSVDTSSDPQQAEKLREASQHSEDKTTVPGVDAEEDDKTWVTGAPAPGNGISAVHGDDDATVIGGAASEAAGEAVSATSMGRKSGRTTILPGATPEPTTADSAGGSGGLPRQETATLGVDEKPENYNPDTRQAEKAQRDTLLGRESEAGRSRQPNVNEERIVRDRFVILERLGKGGMGEVFKARDLRKEEAEDDNPYVAIKFLGEGFSQHPRALISLQREAKRSQQLAHPNVLTVYDFDRDGDRVYMTMEYLNGAPLSGWDNIKFMDGREPSIFDLIGDMSSGLIYAHEHGVVHSDLKPDNVFVTVDGRVKILDFGIARIMDTALEQDSFDAGELGALTMRYASLEMLMGGTDPHPADDIYALGLMAYQLFAGVHPYQGKNALEAKKKGIVPAPLKGLKRYQRKAIEQAIVLERENRTQSAEVFLRQFTGSKTRNLVLLAAVFVLTLSSGYFAYEASLREGPSVPFEQLSPALQQDFVRNMRLGRQSSEIDDWDGASRYYLAAYKLHPRNPEAEQGLEILAQHLVEVAASLQSSRQKQYLGEMIKSYSSNEYLANHEALSAELVRLETELDAQNK